MSIVFEAYTAPPNGTGDVQGLLATAIGSNMSVSGIVDGLLATASGAGYGIGSTTVSGLLAGVEAFDAHSFARVSALIATAYGASFAAPDVSFGLVQGLLGAPTARGYFDVYASPVVSGLSAIVEGFNSDLAIVPGLLGTAFGSDVDPLAHGIVVAYQTPGFVSIQSTGTVVIGEDGVQFDSVAVPSSVYVLADSLGFGDKVAELLTALQKVSSSVDILDALSAFYKLLVSSGFTLGSTSSAANMIAIELVDALRMTAGIGNTVAAFQAVASAIALHDLLARMHPATMSDSVAFGTLLTQSRTALLKQLETVTIGASVSDTITFVAIVADTFAIEDAATAFRTALLQEIDSLGIGATLQLGDSIYYAWVVNTRNKAFTQYENYPFNSFCEFRGRYFGMAADGIYELTGPDDNGTPIQARVRLGLSNLGTGKLKRIPTMYLGYTSNGQLVLKITTTSPDGNKTENWYELAPQTANVAREGRIKIGRGLKSVYFDFTLTNVDGSSFALDKIDLYPIILDRRITGASNG